MTYYIRFIDKDTKNMRFFCIPAKVAAACELTKEDYESQVNDLPKLPNWIEHPNTGEVLQT
jgi:hypothetical protein